MSNIAPAIIEFLADEFKLDPSQVSPDTDLSVDLNLTPDQISDLLQRLQDALNFTLPDELLPKITSVGDLLAAVNPETEPEPA